MRRVIAVIAVLTLLPWTAVAGDGPTYACQNDIAFVNMTPDELSSVASQECSTRIFEILNTNKAKLEDQWSENSLDKVIDPSRARRFGESRLRTLLGAAKPLAFFEWTRRHWNRLSGDEMYAKYVWDKKKNEIRVLSDKQSRNYKRELAALKPFQGFVTLVDCRPGQETLDALVYTHNGRIHRFDLRGTPLTPAIQQAFATQLIGLMKENLPMCGP